MAIDIIRLYQDYNIPYQTEGHKHCHEGWAHTPCPFCTGNPGLHLGYNFEGGNFVCWRCGSHRVIEVVSTLLNVSKAEAFSVVRNYATTGFSQQATEKKIKVKNSRLRLPTNITDIEYQHYKYLKKRGYDPDEIVELWGIQATGPFSILRITKTKAINFAHRIFVPIIWDNKVVSYQGRSISNKTEMRWLACPDDLQIINLKTIIYRHPSAPRRGICVEGVTDVWNIGVKAFGLFGIKWKMEQVNEICRLYDHVDILFDPEPQAQIKAKELEAELRFRGVSCKNHNFLETDPGGYERKQLLKLLSTHGIL